MIGGLTRLGLAGRTSRVLTTVGRRSGLPRSVPVNLVVNDRGRCIVSPYGEMAWVHNVRADHAATLSRGGKEERISLVEVAAEEAGAVLQQYWAENKIARPYFDTQAQTWTDSQPKRHDIRYSGSGAPGEGPEQVAHRLQITGPASP